MPPAHASVCSAEIGQVWQKVEDQRPEIQMKYITEHPGFLPTCLDVSAPKIATLTWWGCLCTPMSRRAILAGPLEVLVGTPMPDRSEVRGQTKSNLPALQVWGFCIGLTTLSCKKRLLRKQQRVTYKNHLCRTSLQNLCHGQQ